MDEKNNIKLNKIKKKYTSEEKLIIAKVARRYKDFTLLEVTIETRKDTSNKSTHGRNRISNCW